MEDLLNGLVVLALMAFALWVAFWLYITLPADMARARHRDPVGWVFVAIFGSPFAAIFLLWLLGDAD